jgi:hypothetical protein
MKNLLQLAITAGVLVLAGQANAGSFNLSFTGDDGTVVAGQVDTILVDGNYELSGGTVDLVPGAGNPNDFTAGTYSALVFNPLFPDEILSSSGYFIYDNELLYGQNPFVSNGGLLFTDGGLELNLFSDGPSVYQIYESNGANVYADPDLSAVPDGGTTAGLFGGALAGLLALRRKLFA